MPKTRGSGIEPNQTPVIGSCDYAKLYSLVLFMQSMQPDHTGMLKIIEKYREKNLNVPVVVEGKNDVNSLREIEFTGEIIIFNKGLSIIRFSEELRMKHDAIIILTDFDRRGRRLRDDIEKFFMSNGGSVDTYLWEYLNRYSGVKTVEEIPFALSRSIMRPAQAGKS